MKKYFIIAFAGVAIFTACKKDSSNGNSATQTTSIDPTNASAVTASIKVWHSTTVAGTPPAPTNNANSPVLDGSSASLAINAYAGGFAVISPSVTSGTIAGYYLKVNGASSYFKVDYSKALQRPAAVQQRPASFVHHVTSHTFFRPSGNPDNTDSSIVIQLPAGITPGTFCMSYWAYDYSGNISNVVTQCITVDALGSTDASAFTGTWKVDAEKDIYIDSNGNLLQDSSWYSLSDSVLAKTDAYNMAHFGYQGYYPDYNLLYCYNGSLSSDSLTSEYVPIVGYPESYFWDIENITFSANGAYYDTAQSIEATADFNTSTCGNVVYDKDVEGASETGGWSYNPTSNKFTAIYQDEDSVLSTQAEQYDVTQNSGGTLILKSTDTTYGEIDISYVRLIKQ